MSDKHIENIKCPTCGHRTDLELWDRIDTDQNPEMKIKVRSGEIFSFVCPECGFETEIQYASLYHDPERRIMIYYVPTDPTGTIAAMKGEFVDEDGNTINLCEGLEGNYIKRVVGQINHMKEKLYIIDKGLDDRIIELMKLFIFIQLKDSEQAISMDDMLLTVNPNGADSFMIITADGKTGFIAFDAKMYESFVDNFGDKLGMADEELIIDLQWAMDFLQANNKEKMN